MLLIIAMPFQRRGDTLLCEAQASNGIEQWSRHFSRIVVGSAVIDESELDYTNTVLWHDVATYFQGSTVSFLPLPAAYSWRTFINSYWQVVSSLDQAIDACQYLQFTFWGLAGDWGTVAARQAIRKHRPYALHADHVSHQTARAAARNGNNLQRLKTELQVPIMVA
jgi:hypothetical protein